MAVTCTRGQDERLVSPSGERRSVGVGETSDNLREIQHIHAQLQIIAVWLQSWLEPQCLAGRTVGLKVKFAGFESIGSAPRIPSSGEERLCRGDRLIPGGGLPQCRVPPRGGVPVLEWSALDTTFGDGPHLLSEEPCVVQVSVDPFQHLHPTALRDLRPDPPPPLFTGLPEGLRRDI